jgi:hypothetical protein
MQRFLAPLTAEQAQQQTLALSQEVEKEVQQRRAEQQLRDAQPRRGPGRPKRELDSNSVLSSSAADSAAAASTSDSEDRDSENSPKRKYTHWLTCPLVFDILRAVKQHSGSARRAVAYLQSSSKHNINGRFNALDHTTVHKWFDHATHQLLPRYQQLIDNEYAYSRVGAAGRPSAFVSHREVEEEIVSTLRQMRERWNTGISINRTSIRWVMHSVINKRCPELLNALSLSRTFISSWAKCVMGWSWRVGTSVASKASQYTSLPVHARVCTRLSRSQWAE